MKKKPAHLKNLLRLYITKKSQSAQKDNYHKTKPLTLHRIQRDTQCQGEGHGIGIENNICICQQAYDETISKVNSQTVFYSKLTFIVEREMLSFLRIWNNCINR